MKVLIVVSAVLAVASAGILAPVAYHGVHVPVLDHNGYQLDTAEVAHAKAAHFAAHAEANARLYGHGLVAPLTYAGLYAHSYYNGLQHIPIIGANGVPLDTPEVVAARINHLAAHAAAKQRVVAPLATYAYGYGHTPVTINGHPVDTPEVAQAKAAHFAAHVEARTRNGHLAVVAPVAAYSYAAPTIVNGVPLDTPEVAHAKAAHLAAHAQAKAHHGLYYY